MIWYKIEKKKPLATQSGCWDGLKSEKILVATRSGKIHIAEMYEGVLDGNKFCNFYRIPGHADAYITDMSPELLGQIGVIAKVSNVQGKDQYAINGPNKYAWYFDSQLELIK